jgi:hypothetical protein
LSEVDRLEKCVKGAGVDVSRLQGHDRRSIPAGRQRMPQGLRVDAPLLVGFHQLGIIDVGP